MLTGYLGTAHTGSAALSVSQPALDTNVTFASIDYRGEPFASPLYYGYHLSWFPRRSSWLGVDVELIHLKVYAQTGRESVITGLVHGASVHGSVPVNNVVERFSISHGLNFLLVNAVARRTLGRAGAAARVTLTGRAGAGPTIPHAESTIDGRSHEGYAWGSPGWHAAAGVHVRLAGHLAAVGEYKFTRTRQSVDVYEGRASSLFSSHHGVFGLSWVW